MPRRIFKVMASDRMNGKTDGGEPRFEVLIVGMNGDLRGKQLPLDAQGKVWAWRDPPADLNAIARHLGRRQ